MTTDAQNRLIYQVESSSDFGERPGPQAIALDGTWELTRNHELALTLHGAERSEQQTLYLKGAIVNAEAHALVFALRRRENDDLTTSQHVTLFGRWQADDHNRLNFLVEKSDASEDRLTLQGGWEVDPHHELLYRYRQNVEGDRRTTERTLVFEGAWDITKADRLVYRLEGSADSAFEFRASLQSPSLLASEGRMVYQIGVGAARSALQRQRVTLFGTWKLNRDLSISFEIPYANGRVQAIRFEGTFALGPRDRLAVALRNSQREGLGVTVTFTKELMPDAELFLRLQKDAQEASAIGGVRVWF